MIQAKCFKVACISTIVLSASAASLAHLAETDFNYRVRFNLILRGHPFDQFVPLTSGSPFLPNTMVAGGIEADGKPVGCVDMGGEVFFADDHGQEKIDGSTLLIMPALLKLIFGAIAVVALLLIVLRPARLGANK